MIRSFRHKGLQALWATGKSGKVDAKMHRRILVRLDVLDASAIAQDMNLPGFNFHALNGFNPTRYTVHINGPWCLTFAFDGADAIEVDLEQYH